MAFKAITVNTPAADPAHILAEDDAALYESLVGGDKVLNVGGKLAATTISNNKIRITDGVVIVGGHVGRIYKGDYEDLTIENGTSGQNRNDLIVARYLAGNSGGADSYGLAVIKGTPGSTATDPIYMQGNLYNGDPQRDFPLYRAKLEGLSIVAVEQLFEVGKTIGELEEEIETLNSNYIIEEGSNSNGHWRKWSNGDLEMWGIYAFSDANVNIQAGNLYLTNAYLLTLPIPSLTVVEGLSYTMTSSGSGFAVGASNGDYKNNLGWRITAGLPYSANGGFQWRCTGTWK